MNDHKDAVYFDEPQGSNATAYRELRLWQKGYLAALQGGNQYLVHAANEFVADVNAKRRELLGGAA